MSLFRPRPPVTPAPVPDARAEEAARRAWLASLLETPALRAAIGSVDRLPVVPTIYTELQRVLVQPGAAMADVASVIEQDPGLVAKTVQLASSAIFGCHERVTDVEAAAARLGMRALQTLVLTISIFDTVERRRLPPSLNLQQMRTRACAAGANARAIDDADPDAFMAAMLSDVGRLGLAVASPEVFEQIARGQGDEETLLDAERAALGGTTHAAIGAFLLGSWGLPWEVVQAVAYHHDPARAPRAYRRLTAIVHVAVSAAESAALDDAGLLEAGFGEAAVEWRTALSAA